MNNGYGQPQNNVLDQNMNNGFVPNDALNSNITNTNPKKKNTKLIIIIAIVVGILAIIGGRYIIALIAADTYMDELDEYKKEYDADSLGFDATEYKKEFAVSEAKEFISKATYQYKVNRNDGTQCYTLQYVEKELGKSPFGTNYTNSSYIIIERDVANQKYNNSVCIVVEEGIGISYTSEENISADSVTSGVTCTLPPECN